MNLLITSPSNIQYLSGFTGSKAIILKLPTKTYFFTDNRYFEEARKNIPKEFTLEPYKKGEFEEIWSKILKKHRITKIGFEPNHLTYSALKSWKKISRPAKLTPEDFAQFRATKTPEEIRLLKRSQQINEQVFYSIKKLLKQGVAETEIAWCIRAIAHDLGTEDLSFEPIVAFGNGSAVPHHKNANRKLKKGDLILIDMGVKYRGYCSDMTRTLFTKTPTPLEAKIYETVLSAQKNAIAHIKPNITGHKAWSFAANLIEKAGYGENFTHGLGHGTGLKIHEYPSLVEKSRDKLQKGMIVTIEPGIYLPDGYRVPRRGTNISTDPSKRGRYGIRIEDMGVITDKGFENFTKAPKELKDCILSLR